MHFDTLVIVAFLLSFAVGIAGIILGHRARCRIHDRGGAGRGLATFALILGGLPTALCVLSAAGPS